MKKENILIYLLVIMALAGLAWSAVSFLQAADDTVLLANNSENYDKALSAELPDKCQTPQGYTDEEWQAHMSHHPERYAECFNGARAKISYMDLEPQHLKSMLDAKSEFTLVDVHVPEQDHIPGTDAVIPYNEIAVRQGELPADKDAPIVLYCRSGNMSETAAKDLIKAGYTNVYNLAGGLKAWQAAGYEAQKAQ